MRTEYGSKARVYVELEQQPSKPWAPKSWWVMMVYTDPRYRDQGLMRRMLQQVCKDADREGVTLGLAVCPGEPNITGVGVRRLYESVGFEVQYGNVMVRHPANRESTCSSKTVTSRGS